MPKIGMRIIKSSVAVFLCFAIYLVRGDGIPFYSAIAAVLCMQPYVSNSRKVAINRIIGTFIGGIAGMLVMMVEKSFLPPDVPVLKYLLVSAAIIPLIYTTVLAKRTSASYITCVVFMSITVSHGQDASPYFFALNRIVDTLIGIFVSLGVNAFHLPRGKNGKLLFVSDLDGTLTDSGGQLSSFTRFKLNQLLQKGAMITVASKRSSSSMEPILKGISFSLPVITMNGAALYDLKKKTYLYSKNIPYATAKEVLGVFDKYGLNCFVHTIVNDILHIYYGDFTNAAEERFYHEHKLRPLKNYICNPLPENRDVVYLMAVDRLETIQMLREEIMNLSCAGQIDAVYYPDPHNEEHYFLEIFSVEASKENAVAELKRRFEMEKVAVFGDDESDAGMIQAADYGYAVANASDSLKKTAPNLIGSQDSDAVVKTMEKLFHSRKLD
ncbi:HAD-IIB family hydrolase [Caproiciproducens faecalis]|nr:HAD-IIB family hydrolase [Caproiciproducens faecalis]